jgi:hypothetical protein
MFRLPIGENVGASAAMGAGVMTVSGDALKLFLSTPTGVRVIDLPAPRDPTISFQISGIGSSGLVGSRQFTVTARGPGGAVDTSYQGMVRFTSGSPFDMLPADYRFTAADQGVHTFTAGFGVSSPGPSWITVADTTAPGTSGTRQGFIAHLGAIEFISDAGRRDLVWDQTRSRSYVTTTHGTIEWRDWRSPVPVPPVPFDVGSSLNGADITPDGRFLYVADGLRGPTQGLFHKVDLATGAVTDIRYERASFEGGAWDVSIAANGKALLSTDFEGSGRVPLREIDLATDTIRTRTDGPGPVIPWMVGQRAHIARSDDRSLLFFAEPNNSSGPVYMYTAATDSFSPRGRRDTFLDDAATAVNRNGTLVAVESDTALHILDASLNPVTTLPNMTGGAAFDPREDILYTVNPATDQLVYYDTRTWAVIDTVPAQQDLRTSRAMSDGVMVAGDNGRLFRSTQFGVRAFDVAPPTVAGGQFNLSPRHQVQVSFGEDVGATLVREDLEVRNLTTGQTVPASAFTFQASGNPTRAFWTANAPLPDGNYRVTLPAGSVADVWGNRLRAPFTFDFFILTGDVNRDRMVNGTDFAILAGNFGKLNATYGQGDLNGDGAVDGSDFALLAGGFGKTMPAPVAGAAPPPVSGAASASRPVPGKQAAPPVRRHRPAPAPTPRVKRRPSKGGTFL